MKDIIYLDNNSTTPIDPRVLDAMMPYFSELYANASSNHIFGIGAKSAIDSARKSIAELINCDPFELIFTSGATEAINLALKGLAENDNNKKKHIVTVQTEHRAVLDTCYYLEKHGFEVTYLPVKNDGLIDLEILENAITEDTLMVVVMMVNNETGVIQPLAKISKLAHEKSAFFMTDATQAFGKLPIDVNLLGVDILSFSGHKIYGPKGIGGLYIRLTGKYKPKIKPQLHGGGHEKGLRSGTLNVPGIVALGKISEIASAEMEENYKRIEALRDFLETELLKIEKTFINGNIKSRIFNVSNICFEGADSDAIIMGLGNPENGGPAIIVSNGSACSSHSIEPSHVLKSMGLSDAATFSSIRFSLSRFNSRTDIELLIDCMSKLVFNLRSMN